MTEAELLEVATSYFGLSIDMLGLYLTLTSGYLIVAFFIGARLTIFQLVIVSTLYVFAAGHAIRTIFIFTHRGMAFSALHGAESGMHVSANPVIFMTLIVFMAGGIFASLAFMWSVRHPKTE